MVRTTRDRTTSTAGSLWETDSMKSSRNCWSCCLTSPNSRLEPLRGELQENSVDLSFLFQELYLVYCQDPANKHKIGTKSTSKFALEVCHVCKQVLVRDDLTEHFQSHYMENNFPKLDKGPGLGDGKLASSSAWRK